MFVIEYNSCTNYFFIEIISKLKLLLSILKLNSKFNFVIIKTINLFVFVNKSIKVVNNILIKKKTLDKNILDTFKNKELLFITFDIKQIVNKNLNRLVE